MKDTIDERNERERISKSIIKYWNVNYVPNPTPDEEAQKVIDRLAKEAEEDDAKKQAEIDEAKAQADEAYNATTGSYSGEYGQNEVIDDVTKGQIEKILHEKTDAIRDLFEHSDEL
jgi:hypothetical protein